MDALDDPLAWATAQAGADPVRQRVLQALARRAMAQPPGALRERLLARLQQRSAAPLTELTPRQLPDAPRPLGLLLAELQAGNGAELRNVQAHHRTWSALRLTRRLAEVSAPVPEHLGPLNNQVLVSRALQQLQTLAPAYLQRLLTQLDTLAALAPLEPAPVADRPARKTASGRRR
ncbi:DUF2894 domain-containing protein [Pelomonas cellulosilytica]|uniref:DUF2894 domain-containing protein n=1 Tax=Pelomonas cellulosilytica TaxID=2906762 RepID=A0ABS8XPX9_9BURK|nr:DUF2894 domain-containing protein [Pelomonas sp. P8]MCE4553775.1 DUF2894 domain-containing protein [Pelomonas sp. P8]